VALSVLVSVDDDVLNCIDADSNVGLYLTTSVLHIASTWFRLLQCLLCIIIFCYLSSQSSGDKWLFHID